METIIAYTHGSSRGNPGPAGVGVHITKTDGTLVEEVKLAIGNASDNFAEYYAVMLAMETLEQIYGDDTKVTKFEFRLDSELVQKQLSNERQIKEPGLVPMFIEIHNHLVEHFPHVVFTHISREKNKEAERLVKETVEGK